MVKYFRNRQAAQTASPLEIQKRNFRNVQIDAIGIGLASAAAPFLPVFLARLGATNIQVGLADFHAGFHRPDPGDLHWKFPANPAQYRSLV
jgi:hypothetical protein